MQETEAAQIIRRIFVLMPAAKTYWSQNTVEADKRYVFARWQKSLEPYTVEEAEEALQLFITADPKDANTVTAPVQMLIERMDANRPPPPKRRSNISPTDRTPRETNMLEAYLAGLAVRDQEDWRDQLRPIVESVA